MSGSEESGDDWAMRTDEEFHKANAHLVSVLRRDEAGQILRHETRSQEEGADYEEHSD